MHLFCDYTQRTGHDLSSLAVLNIWSKIPSRQRTQHYIHAWETWNTLPYNHILAISHFTSRFMLLSNLEVFYHQRWPREVKSQRPSKVKRNSLDCERFLMSILAPLSIRSPCRPLQMTLALHTDYLFVPVTMTLEQTCLCVMRGSTGRPTTSRKETLRMFVWMCV